MKSTKSKELCACNLVTSPFIGEIAKTYDISYEDAEDLCFDSLRKLLKPSVLNQRAVLPLLEIESSNKLLRYFKAFIRTQFLIRQCSRKKFIRKIHNKRITFYLLMSYFQIQRNFVKNVKVVFCQGNLINAITKHKIKGITQRLKLARTIKINSYYELESNILTNYSDLYSIFHWKNRKNIQYFI